MPGVHDKRKKSVSVWLDVEERATLEKLAERFGTDRGGVIKFWIESHKRIVEADKITTKKVV